ncbi:hypothetical protein GCM10010271_68090 [Streptomyces kurssanovii]|nr:hypothetical protein GCM10010271_68090 [Streptomyces kurssanovii]
MAKVVIAGDTVVDWLIRPLPESADETRSRRLDDPADTCWLPGGAMLLAKCLGMVSKRQHIITPIPDWEKNPPRPGEKRFHHSYTLLKNMSEHSHHSWQVDRFLGFKQRPQNARDSRISSDADVVLLDDAGLDFRGREDLWPKAIMNPKSTLWAVLKMGGPVAEGKLWAHLRSSLCNRLVVVTTVNDLRHGGNVAVSRDLSWERSARDLAAELIHKPPFNDLSDYPYVIVSFGPAGALLSEGSRGVWPPRFTLFFEPDSMEGDWGKDGAGRVMGHTSLLAACIAKQIVMANGANPDIEGGIRLGLSAMRVMDKKGYVTTESDPERLKIPPFRLPNGSGLAKANIPPPILLRGDFIQGKETPRGGLWEIMHENHSMGLEQLAQDIVRYGLTDVLTDVPRAQFGGFLTVDRREIEAFRAIRALISQYCLRRPSKPISMAVFGAPGSGKSYAVTEVINDLRRSQKELGLADSPREFNLSQFTSPADLVDALHLVRDERLQGGIPLVFWDEFDTSFESADLGWLRYFLSPMQDGKFKDRGTIHPIGPAIFVFAGGRSRTLKEFSNLLSAEKFAAAKGPDFLSRLRGHIDIAGPGIAPQEDPSEPVDVYFIIRRAILIRSILERKAEHLFYPSSGHRKVVNVDPGILRALLLIPDYKHGTRSIEAIVDMSTLAGMRAFERSSLPSQDQLHLHVDGKKFLYYIRQVDLPESLDAESLRDSFQMVFHDMLDGDELTEFVNALPNLLGDLGYRLVTRLPSEPLQDLPNQVIADLAKAEYNRWLKSKKRRGWVRGKEHSASKKTHLLVAWEALSEERKSELLDFASKIPRILHDLHYSVKSYTG